MNLSSYKGKKILITGHTGFKGSWLSEILIGLGANVSGFALQPPTSPSMFELLKLEDRMKSYVGDIRNLDELCKAINEQKPDIVIHMAAQPLVREGYNNPVYTYETNVMGTVNICEAVRQSESVRSFLNVTTDKVYRNKEWIWGYRENDEMNGFDPYSNSKSCSELITDCYINSFFSHMDIAASTCRAGNVIGGGDFAADRIIPDCIRAASRGEEIIVRNPHSVRPYQHVLEPLFAYLMIAITQFYDKSFAGAYNVGPNDVDTYNTGELVSVFCRKWNMNSDIPVNWTNVSDGGPHEAGLLKLDCSKIKNSFGWEPIWNLETAIEKIVEWNRVYFAGEDIGNITRQQINDYIVNIK